MLKFHIGEQNLLGQRSLAFLMKKRRRQRNGSSRSASPERPEDDLWNPSNPKKFLMEFFLSGKKNIKNKYLVRDFMICQDCCQGKKPGFHRRERRARRERPWGEKKAMENLPSPLFKSQMGSI